MIAEVIMPQLGETVAEGKILAWFKAVGEEVREGDNIFEVETDKVTVEVQAIASGPLAEIRVPAGTVAKVGAVVGVIGGAPAALPRTVQTPAALASKQTRSPFEEVSTASGHYGRAKGPLGMRITPLARRLIALNGLDAHAIAEDVQARGGTRIAQKDVRAAIEASLAEGTRPEEGSTAAEVPSSKEPHAPRAYGHGDAVIELNSIRRRTGERLAENWRTIPHVFQAIEVDFTRVDTVRAAHKERFQREHGAALTYLPFIARATCLALREFPEINARLQGTSLALSRDIHLGIAVDLSHDGLVVPVIRHADELTVLSLSRLVEKARAGRLTADDLSGGTYSISNNGAFGTTFTAPIINAPQVAILSVDAIRKRATVVATPEGEFITARPIGMVGQSFDHRAFDGAYSAAFLSRLKALMEGRDWAVDFQ
jgi:pyruvate/2-oxoglutarate dehydrogenase complex dihydrolipoamide acyltransferase (E2) component